MWDILSADQIPLWLKISYTLFIFILIPVYWTHYGPGNFLWFSDIALFVTAATLWLVYRLGYDSRALLYQTLLAGIVLPVSYFLTNPSQNVNWVRGLGNRGQQNWLPAPLYLILLMLAFPIVLYLPTHFLLRKLFS